MFATLFHRIKNLTALTELSAQYEGCRDSWKLCKRCQIFILWNKVANIWITKGVVIQHIYHDFDTCSRVELTLTCSPVHINLSTVGLWRSVILATWYIPTIWCTLYFAVRQWLWVYSWSDTWTQKHMTSTTHSSWQAPPSSASEIHREG